MLRVRRASNFINTYHTNLLYVCQQGSVQWNTNTTSSFTHPDCTVFGKQMRRNASSAAQQTVIFNVWQTMSNSTPVSYMQEVLTQIHDFTGLSWWASIVLSTFILRTMVTLPLSIYQHKITARIEKITLEMPAIVAELKKEAAVAMNKFNWSEQHTRRVYNRSLKKQWDELVIRDNCHPAKTFIVLWGQIPLWICQSVALRNLVHMLPDPSSLQAKIIFTQLTLGGFGWIPNLTEVDSSYILPVSLGLINLAIIETQAMMRTRPTNRLHKYATNGFRMLSAIMVPVACSVPSALCIYWVASSSYGLIQNLFLASPKVRRSLGIPHAPSELQNPYEHMWKTLKVRIGYVEATKSKQLSATVNDHKSSDTGVK